MALDICNSVVSEIIKDLVYETIRQVHYPFQFNKYVKDLVKEKGNISTQRESVQDRVNKAKEDTQKIDIVVEKWLDEAQTLIDDAMSMEKMVETNKSCCCIGHCPNWIWRFRQAKKMEKKTKEIVDHYNKNKFEQVGRPATPLGIKYYSSEGFMLFDSMKSAYDQLLKALKDDEVSMIGLYGMGGCGKTTLAQQVGKATTKLFNKVVFVVVSNFVDIQKIQNSLASHLGVQFRQEEGEQERAQRLRLRLSNGEKILIILDDVWKKLDFNAIGIPLSSDYKRCKVLLTTRRQEVCSLMDCQRTIILNLLSKEEAWTLLQHYAKISNKTPHNLKDLAQEIAYECKGLAVAIAAVGSSLKGKNQVEWEEALDTLRHGRLMNIEEGLQDPYPCLKLSFDYLKNDFAKSIFLLCSAFPEDFEIHEDDLVRYGIGLGLLGKIDSFKRARNILSVAKDKLIYSCLLMKTNNGQRVKLHDVVRDVALRIAKEGNFEIVGPERSQVVLKEDGTKKENSTRYLWLNKVASFPKKVHFPKLFFLCVCVDKPGGSNKSCLANECFKGMEELRVLVLQFEYLPYFRTFPFFSSSFQLLTNLRCLKLEGWVLGNISSIGSLNKLQCLALWVCSFNKLPDEIIQLENLRLLDVRHCEIEENPYEVIGRCSKLEELYFIQGTKYLKQHSAGVFCRTKLALKLERYCIGIGRDLDLSKDILESSRVIAVEEYDVSNTNATIKDLVERAEILHLKRFHGGFKNIIPEMIQGIEGMNKLIKLVLDGSEDIEFLVGSIQLKNIFSRLIEFEIRDMKRLKAFYDDTCPNAHHMLNVHNLKVLILYKCPKLTHVFTFSFAESLMMLEELHVEQCDELKHLFIDEMQLHQKRYVSLLAFQKLKQLQVEDCRQLEYLFAQANHEVQNHSKFRRIEFPSLKKMFFLRLPNLISICQENDYSTFQSLEVFSLQECSRLNIKSINDLIVGPSILQEFRLHTSQMTNVAPPFQALQNVKLVKIKSCQIDCVFQLTALPVTAKSNTLASSLLYLILEDLSELRYISKGPTQCINFQNLYSMDILECRELKCIFSLSIVRTSISQLRDLTIKGCEKLEQIIEDEESFDEFKRTSNSFGSPIKVSQSTGPYSLCSLKNLFVSDCPLLTSLFTKSTAETLTSLRSLYIQKCERLRYVIRDERVEGNKSGEIAQDDGHPILPNLKLLWLIDLPNLIDVYPGIKQQSESMEYYHVYKCPKLVQAYPQKPEESIETGSSEEVKKELDDKAVEENKLVAYDPNNAIKKISLDDEAGPSGAVAIPCLPYEPCKAAFGDPTSSLPISHILALPLEEAHAHAGFRDGYLDHV